MLFYAALILILGSGVHAGHNTPTVMPTTTPTTYVPSISPAEAPTSKYAF